MPELFRRLLDPAGRRDAAAGWSDGLVQLHRAADVLLFLALLGLPVLLVYLRRRRPDLVGWPATALLATFLGLCAATFLLDAVAFPAPLARLDAVLKVLAVATGWAGLLVLVSRLPHVLALRTPQDLAREVERRREVEEELRQAHALLDRRVKHRTKLLAAANSRLTAEVAAKELAQRRLLAKDTITHALAESETLQEAAPRILRAIGETLGWHVGAIWLVEGDAMRRVAFWQRDGLDVAAFEESSRTLSLRSGEGFPGRIWAQRFAAWIPDLALDPEFQRVEPAAQAGLHAAFGFPIVADERVLGVVEFFHRQIASPDQPLLDMAESIGSQVGQFVERRRVQAELRRVNAELRLLTDSLPALISYVGADRRYRFHNRAYEEWFGPQARDQVGKTLPEALGEETYRSIVRHVDRALGGERVSYEARLPYRAGGARVVHATYVPDVAPEGDVRGFFSLVTDITDRKAAEEALRESEARFRTMADTAPVYIATLDEDGEVEFLNRAWLEFRGRPFEEDEAEGWVDAIHPDDRLALHQTVVSGLHARRAISVEARVRRADGEYRWIFAQAIPRRGAGRFEGYLATGIDITDRRRAEQALRDGEERFRLLVESVRDYAIHGLDPQGRVTSWNAGAERLHGYSAGEILGEHFSTFFPPEAVEAGTPARLAAEAEREGSSRDEGWRLRRDGTRFWGEVVLTALRDPDGRLRGFSRIVHDATGRRETDEALRESESRMRTIVNTSLDAVVAMDEGGRIREWNDQAERMFGWTRREALGQLLAETIVPPRYRESHARGLARFLATGEGPVLARRIEIEAVRRDGTEIPIEIAISPSRRGGRYVFSAFLRDLSDRKAMEALRRRSDDLESEKHRVEEASRLKSEFLANMSHELRTPMNAVIGFAELLHDGRAGPLSADQREYLGDILASARHLLQLINDVLDLSKVEAGKMPMHPRPVDLARLVEEVRDNLRALAAQKRIRVSIDTAHAPAEVVADASRVQQILYNYLSNALKFTPENGRVTVRVGAEGDDAYRLEVEDDGPGIALGDQHRLFVEFQQLDAGAAKRHPGTGLGLALTRRLAEAQGGRVGVDSAPGKGSRFFAVLPRTAPPDASDAPSGPRGRDVLVVAARATERARVADILSRAGYDTDTVASAVEAGLRCRDRAYAVVVLGWVGDEGGGATLAAVRDTQRNRGTPVLAVAIHPSGRAVTALPIEGWVDAASAETAFAHLVPSGAGPSTPGKILVMGRDASIIEPAVRALSISGLAVEAVAAAEPSANGTAAAVVVCARPGDPAAFDLFERARAATGAPAWLWEGEDGVPAAPEPSLRGRRLEAAGLLQSVATCVTRGEAPQAETGGRDGG